MSLPLGCAIGTPEPLKTDDGGTASCADPDTAAPCTACGSGKVCQVNGCYNGYVCDTATNHCKAPSACP